MRELRWPGLRLAPQRRGDTPGSRAAEAAGEDNPLVGGPCASRLTRRVGSPIMRILRAHPLRMLWLRFEGSLLEALHDVHRLVLLERDLTEGVRERENALETVAAFSMLVAGAPCASRAPHDDPPSNPRMPFDLVDVLPVHRSPRFLPLRRCCIRAGYP